MRRNFIERNFHADWDDPLAYHLVVSSSKLGIDLTCKVIIEAAKKFSTCREYIPGVRDRRKGFDRRIAQQRRGDRRSGLGVWTIRDIETAVLRKGRPVRALSRLDRRKADRRKGLRRERDM